MDRDLSEARRFGELYREHVEVAKRMARRRLGRELRRRVDTEDVVQEAFYRAALAYLARDRASPRGGEPFLRWLSVVIENTVRTLARRHVVAARRSVRREQRLDPSGGGPAVAAGKSASSILRLKEQMEAVLTALARLSPRQREVIELVHIEGLPVREAAERLGKTRGATSVLLCEALGRLGHSLRGKVG